MLKKTGIGVAIATAGLLALSPLAFADDVDQETHQSSFEDNGIGKGNQPLHGNDGDFCNANFQGFDQETKSFKPGDCETTGESFGSKTEQAAKNSDDKGGSYDKDDRESNHAN